jgi:hypothetical protein
MNELSIKQYSEEVAATLAAACVEQMTGKITIVFNLKNGGIGSATATTERAFTPAR